jgi:hypothetical protein
MRGREAGIEGLFGCAPLEQRIPADRPLRMLKGLADAALAELSDRFEALHSKSGRP